MEFKISFCEDDNNKSLVREIRLPSGGFEAAMVRPNIIGMRRRLGISEVKGIKWITLEQFVFSTKTICCIYVENILIQYAYLILKTTLRIDSW